MTKAPNLNPKPDVLGTMQAGGDLALFQALNRMLELGRPESVRVA
jgi:hypothetical protein